MAEADPIGAAVAALAVDPDTVALAGADIFGGELAGDVLDRGPKRAIVIAPSGGVSMAGASKAEFDSQRIDLIAYGATPAEAQQLLAVAARCLWLIERQVFAGTLIHWVNRAGGFGRARDSDTQWPQAFQSFQILYSLKAIG